MNFKLYFDELNKICDSPCKDALRKQYVYIMNIDMCKDYEEYDMQLGMWKKSVVALCNRYR